MKRRQDNYSDTAGIETSRKFIDKQLVALMNHMRAYLYEYGITTARGKKSFSQLVANILGDSVDGYSELPVSLIPPLRTMWERYEQTLEQRKDIEKQRNVLMKQSQPCQRLIELEGVGEVCVAMLFCSLGDGKGFKNGRQASAYVGVTPKQVMLWWHKTLRIRQPRGWDYQINNTPVVVLSPQYLRRLLASKNVDIISVSGFDAGTVFNRLSQEMAVRVGRPGKLNQSHFTNSLFGASKGDSKLAEWYLLASLEGGFVLYDATIDGNFIGSESPYVEQSEKWVLRHTYGLVLAGERADFELSYKVTSREVVGAEQHRYMRCKISYRI